jgi:hypothetical protein
MREHKEERITPLRALANKHPNAEHVGGYVWKNPLNPHSRRIRWTADDLELFRQFQHKFYGYQLF